MSFGKPSIPQGTAYAILLLMKRLAIKESKSPVKLISVNIADMH